MTVTTLPTVTTRSAVTTRATITARATVTTRNAVTTRATVATNATNATNATQYHADNWFTGAACRGRETDSFYLGENARGRNKRNQEEAAKRVCGGCPVVRHCLKAALDNDETFGVWGGMTPEERAEFSAGRLGIAV